MPSNLTVAQALEEAIATCIDYAHDGPEGPKAYLHHIEGAIDALIAAVRADERASCPADEQAVAHNLCRLRAIRCGLSAHPWVEGGCQYCRADIVRLIDGRPAVASGEITRADVAWLKERACVGYTPSDYTAEQCAEFDRYQRILNTLARYANTPAEAVHPDTVRLAFVEEHQSRVKCIDWQLWECTTNSFLPNGAHIIGQGATATAAIDDAIKRLADELSDAAMTAHQTQGGKNG